MAVFESSAAFSLRSTVRLYLRVTTTPVSGGTQIDYYSYAQRNSGETRAPFSSIATKQWGIPGGRTTSTSGSASASGSGTWAYDFRNGDPQVVYSFTRYVPYSQGSSITVTARAADGSGGLIGSANTSVSVSLATAPTTGTVPTVNGLSVGSANSLITNAGFSPVNNGSVSTSNSSLGGTVFSQSPSGGTTATLGSQVSYFSYTYVAPPPPPSSPTGLYVSGTTTSSIVLNWNAVSGASGYSVYRNGTFLTNTSSTNYNFTGLSPNTSYTLGVLAYNSGGNSGTSSIVGTTLANTFSTPSVVGQSRATATTLLTNAGFGSVSVNLINIGATSANNLLVLAQSPTGGTTATSGSVATIDVYNYLVPTPNILGLTESAATTSLSNSGFLTVSASLSTSGATVANNLTVGSQNPTGGTLHNPSSTVAFTIYNFLTAVPNVVGLSQDTALNSLASLGFTQITTTLTDVGVTQQNAGTVKSQTPVNSATTYNPKSQAVTLTIYSLGVVGRRYSSTTNSMVALSTSKRFDGTSWIQTTLAKRFDGSVWKDISN
jgi:beta-lactam-binding protein with PASTA domain